MLWSLAHSFRLDLVRVRNRVILGESTTAGTPVFLHRQLNAHWQLSGVSLNSQYLKNVTNLHEKKRTTTYRSNSIGQLAAFCQQHGTSARHTVLKYPMHDVSAQVGDLNSDMGRKHVVAPLLSDGALAHNCMDQTRLFIGAVPIDHINVKKMFLFEG